VEAFFRAFGQPIFGFFYTYGTIQPLFVPPETGKSYLDFPIFS